MNIGREVESSSNMGVGNMWNMIDSDVERNTIWHVKGTVELSLYEPLAIEIEDEIFTPAIVHPKWM